MDTEENLEDLQKVLLIIIIASTTLLLSQQERRWWVRPWLRKRNVKGHFHLVHNELLSQDKESFLNFVRMDETTFNNLLQLIRPDIGKEDTKFRDAISARDRLTITLRYLATGESYKSLMYSFRVGHSTISKIIPDVCQAIYKNLKSEYLKIPNTEAEWLDIAKEFEEQWNLPNTIGAMDGKHIIIQAPASEGSAYFNYKGTHSIVLLAVVDANYKFVYVDVGTNGRISDGGVFKKSKLASALANNDLNFPEDKPLPGRDIPIPYVIVADAAFPLSKRILKPFPFRNMTKEQRWFNYRLSRARRVVENAFGILSNRFRVLLNTIHLKPEKAQIITLACVALHNFLAQNCKSNVTLTEKDIDNSYTFKYNLSVQAGNRSKDAALSNRAEYVEYVSGVGAVPWQYDLA